MPDEEIQVVIEPEVQPPPVVVGTEQKVTTKQDPDPLAALQEQYDTLKADREADAARRVQAESRAADEAKRREAAEREVASVRTEVAETRLSTVEQGMAAAQAESAAAKQEWIAAQEAGDWKRAADAQERLADARARLIRLDEAKTDLSVQKTEQQNRTSEQRTDAPVSQPDPVETFIASREKPVQDWLRSHPEEAKALALGTNPRRAAKIVAADNDAVAEGIDRNTPAYFAHVEKFLGMTKDATHANGSGNGTAKTTQRRAAAPPVAPVQASAGGVSGGVEVRLTQGEARAATDGSVVWNYDDPTGQKRFKKGDPVGHTEYARRKQAMMDQGLYDKSYVEN